jgi:formylglycine-generating enzyme required for sulfatase activity
VENVSWEDVQRFLRRVNDGGDGKYRLPSEAEWEYACRAGMRTRYSFGERERQLDEHAWYCDNSERTTHPVGEKEPNGWGLHDMHGDVWEWCSDDWHDDYDGAPEDGSSWADSPRADARVLRGGSWSFSAYNCRSAYRGSGDPSDRYDSSGFRLARTR